MKEKQSVTEEVLASSFLWFIILFLPLKFYPFGAEKEISKRYQKVNKKHKWIILDEFVALTGYNRCYASYLLRNHEKKYFQTTKQL